MRRKLVPTFFCPPLRFRRLVVCLNLGTLFSLDLVLGLVLGRISFLWPGFGWGFDPHLCVGLRFPGAPGFPCKTNDLVFRAWYNLSEIKQYSLPTCSKHMLKPNSMIQISMCVYQVKHFFTCLLVSCEKNILQEVRACPSLPLVHSHLEHLSSPVKETKVVIEPIKNDERLKSF